MLGVEFFFLQTNFDFQLTIFEKIFLYHSKAIVVPSINLKRYFTCDLFFRKFMVVERLPFWPIKETVKILLHKFRT